MQVLVLADEQQRAEFPPASAEIQWEFLATIADVRSYPDADVVIDLLFEDEEGHGEFLLPLLPRTIIISSVIKTLEQTSPSFTRINGWNQFFQKPIIEATGVTKQAEAVFALLGKTLHPLPDVPGFVSPRVISMIINEAFISLNESVSTADEINTAMKLGTNYPYGPFEWAERIGKSKIQRLLTVLSEKNPRYTPAPGL